MKTDSIAAGPGLRRGLYLVTPDCDDTATLLALVQTALSGRPALVQYRSKLASVERKTEQASLIARLCRDHDIRFIVNDSVELALAVGADGVHVGRDDGDPARIRALLGPERILGVSCYDDWQRAEAAIAAGADYVAFGAMYPSTTKPATVRAPTSLLEQARAREVACAAIGGITLDNAAALIAAGADLLAVISDVFAAPDPATRAKAYRTLFPG